MGRKVTGVGAIEDGSVAVLLQPVRYKIVRELRRAGEALYIDEIAKRIGENPRLVSFHLATLQQNEFVTSEFRIVEAPRSRGKAGRFFMTTQKVDKVLNELSKEFKN